jgi:hypothetical protein
MGASARSELTLELRLRHAFVDTGLAGQRAPSAERSPAPAYGWASACKVTGV